MAAVVFHADHVLPGDAAPIADGAVVVAGRGHEAGEGTILDVGSAAETLPRHAGSGVDVVRIRGAVLPGLVNAHTHLELTVMRGFLEDLDFRSWIFRLTRARREALAPDALLDSARFGIAEGLLAGITTYADTNDSGAPFHAMLDMGVRGISYQEVFGPDPAQCAESLAGLRAKVDALHQRATPLVRAGVSPHAPYSVCDALFEGTAAFAIQDGLPVAVHIAESADESSLVQHALGGWADSHRSRGMEVVPRADSPIRLLERVGVLDARPLLIHCVRVDGGAHTRRAGCIDTD